MELMGWSVGGHLRRIGAKSAAQSAVGKQLESCFYQDGCDGVFARAALLPQQVTEFNGGMSQHFTVTQTGSPAQRLGPLVHIGEVLNLRHKSGKKEEMQTIV